MATKAILVLDPDQAIADLLALILREEGYEVILAGSLEEASSALSARHFDLIITEALAQRDIFRFDPTFLAELKSLAGDTPIILCSVYPSTDHLCAHEFGLAAVVPKPFDIDRLSEKVNRLLGKAGPTSDGE